jgi:hypothetical protein
LDKADHHTTFYGKEDDRVPGRIALVPLQFVRRDIDLGADGDMRTFPRRVISIIGYRAIGVGVAVKDVLDVDFIAPIGVGLTAAGILRKVRPFEVPVPLADGGIAILPLAEIAGIRTWHQGHE